MVGDGLEGVEEGVDRRGVGEVVGVVGEFDDVVVGGMEEEEVGEGGGLKPE